MSAINGLRAKKAGTAVNKSLMVLPADAYREKTLESGKTYEFFQLGAQVLTVKAIEKAVVKGVITVDWEPRQLDAKGKKTDVILDEIHIKIADDAEMMITDSGFIGFGKPGVMISAADLLA